MIIKKFVGKTEAEAVEQAKKELGENIVIMNVKNTKKKGLFSFLRKSLVEVTVGMEEESERRKEETIMAAKENAVPILKPKYNKDIIFDSPEDFEEKLSKKLTGDTKLEQKLDSLQSLIEERLSNETKENDMSDDESEEDMSVSFLKLIYKTLIDNEVAEKYANELVDEISTISDKNANLDYLLSNIYQKMILKFGQPVTIPVNADDGRVIFFIGPTGVGKTTTIAKIASILCVNHKKKVALITTDTYRIAASEQLKTYASIMKAPFKVVYTEEEMQVAVNEFKDYDFILVDTAGHSHYNESQKDSIAHFLNSVDEEVTKDVYLVVSATTKYRDLLAIADAYSEFTDYKLIFTKLDETTTFGNLFNLCMHTKAPMSYVTCGQDVPSDIDVFSPQNTVKQLLGGR